MEEEANTPKEEVAKEVSADVGTTKKVKLGKVGIFSFIKVYSLALVLMGFIFGAFVSIQSLIMGDTFGGGVNVFTGFGLLAIVVVPIIYGIMGIIFGFIAAVLWNLVVKITGGLEINIEG